MPLTWSGALKAAPQLEAPWQPVPLALIDPPNAKGTKLGGPAISFSTHASAHALVFPITNGGDLVNKLFDMETETVRPLGKAGIVAGGSGEWQFKGGNAPRLLVRQGATVERSYPFPAQSFEELNAWPSSLFEEAVVVADEERVEFLVGLSLFRWNVKSGALETVIDTKVPQGKRAIARDGESFLAVTTKSVSEFSTRDGRRTALRKLAPMSAESTHLSAFGRYALYDPDSMGDSQVWHLIDTADGREKWNFTLSNWRNPVAMSPDEKWLAIGDGARKVWEVHDLPSGALVKELAMVPNATSAAFSPDGATLYSVADGVLYRQRAR